MSSLTGPADISTSTLLVYCDNDPMEGDDARWQPVPDDMINPSIEGKNLLNSKRDAGVNKECFDQFSFVRRSTTNLGCQDRGVKGEVLMETFDFPVPPFSYKGRPVPVLADPRSVVSVSLQVFTHDNRQLI